MTSTFRTAWYGSGMLGGVADARLTVALYFDQTVGITTVALENENSTSLA
ncbi:hypothetical protein [Polynucleobacter rarus]|nr:hypothetical protein [Polynucleobacter rarus]